MKVTPPTFETTYQAAGLEWPAGDLVASVDVFLSGEIFHIPAARFLVPKRENDLPFVVLGQEPLFAMAEVRFRGWEARVGIRPRPKPWQETVRGPP